MKHADLNLLKKSEEYLNYLYVRERVLKMMAHNEKYTPSQYWQEELFNFDYMFDASPLIIKKFRHHCYHITGLKVYDYRSHQSRPRKLMCSKLDSLMKIDNGNLFVSEPKRMGGFGFEHNGYFFNLDTLKYYESMIALNQKNLLHNFAENSDRKLVWEIGGGWGGFAYQFNTLFGNMTYIIQDLPEVILFSALYLKTMFPQKSIKIVTESDASKTFSQWADYDLIFISPSHLAQFNFEKIDLAVNMVSFQEMTTDQVHTYVSTANRHKCTNFYSLNRVRSKYNPEIKNVNNILLKFYDLETAQILDVSYNYFHNTNERTAMSIGRKIFNYALKKSVSEEQKDLGKMPYQHIIGTLRYNGQQTR
jgi:hypothetical protein